MMVNQLVNRQLSSLAYRWGKQLFPQIMVQPWKLSLALDLEMDKMLQAKMAKMRAKMMEQDLELQLLLFYKEPRLIRQLVY